MKVNINVQRIAEYHESTVKPPQNHHGLIPKRHAIAIIIQTEQHMLSSLSQPELGAHLLGERHVERLPLRGHKAIRDQARAILELARIASDDCESVPCTSESSRQAVCIFSKVRPCGGCLQKLLVMDQVRRSRQ